MVKVIGPLFSQAAHGKVGAIVFQSTMWGTMCRPHVLQRYKPTALQLQQNAFFGEAADAWRVLPEEEKQEYKTRAVKLNMTGFNLYIKENIQHP